jgi:RHS repeat-associated protein
MKLGHTPTAFATYHSHTKTPGDGMDAHQALARRKAVRRTAMNIAALGIGLCLSGIAGATTYYGPPYNTGGATAGQFQSSSEALNSILAYYHQNYPTGSPVITYHDQSTEQSQVAINVSDDVHQFFASVWSSQGSVDTRKVTGGCQRMCGGTSGIGSSEAQGSKADAARDARFSGGALFAGDPINVVTGNKFQADTDYRSDEGLAFRRFYNSKGTPPPAHMGALWRHIFDRHLRIENPLAGAIGGTSVVTAERPDGSMDEFRLKGSAWANTPDSINRLSQVVNTGGPVTGYDLYVGGTAETEHYNPLGVLTSITAQSGSVTTFSYSDASTDPTVAPSPGLLLEVDAPSGRSLHLTYDASSRLSLVTLPDGGTLSYSYDAAGNLTRVTYPDATSRSYLYAERSYIDSSAYPSALTGVLDEKGVRYESTWYDYTGKAYSTGFAGGVDGYNIRYYSTVSSGVISPLGVTTTVNFADNLGNPGLVSSDNLCSASCPQPYKARTYDSNGYPASYTDYLGAKTLTTYDANGFLNQRVEASGTDVQRTTNTSWDTVHRQPLTQTVSNAQGAVVARKSWSYNARGQVTAECALDPAINNTYACGSQANAPVGVQQSRYTYCDAVDTSMCPVVGLLLTVDGPRTDVADITTRSYYLTTDESGCGVSGGSCHRKGDLYRTTDALGHSSVIAAYDKGGRPVRWIDANGVVTDASYSPRGWLATKTVRAKSDGSASTGDAVTTLVYEPTGALKSITDPDGVVMNFTYDDAHRLIDAADGQGNHVHYTLNAVGSLTKEETFDASGVSRRSQSRRYNGLGQLISVTDGRGHVVFDATASGSYDANGNLVAKKDAAGIAYKDTYDALGRVISSVANVNGSDIATKATTTTYTLDALDQLRSVTDPDGLVTTYSIDGLSNQVGLISPDTGTQSATFDAAGNALAQTDAKATIANQAFDALGRKTSATYVDTSLNVAFHYDEANTVTGCVGSFPVGRLTRVVEAAVTTVYCYDNQGRVAEQRQTQGTVTDATDYVYTKAGRLAAIASPSGLVTEYGRNSLGQVISVTVTPASGTASAVVTSATYLPFGPVLTYTLGNGQTITRTYDANYQFTDVTSPALNLHVARDAIGNIVALGNSPGASPATETYTYDSLYRLTGVKNASGTIIEAYSYSKAGDRLSKTAPGLATGNYGYQSGTHHLTSVGTGTRTYDANGSTTEISSAGTALGYDYNGRGKLTAVQQAGATVATYTYDATSHRIAKTIGNVTTRYAYGPNGLLGEYGAKPRDYIWMDDTPVGVVDISGVNYVHADGLNTPRAVSSSTGLSVWSWTYVSNPFGELAVASSQGYTFNLRLPGQYFDAESGLSYNVNRDYEPAIGRYIQSDPIGLAGGTSTYLYTSGRPLINTDPLGEDDSPSMYNPNFWNPGSPLAGPSCDDGYWGRYRDRYIDWTADHVVDVGPYAFALAGGLWPKSLAPATGGRPALLGSTNPLTSVPRALGVPGSRAPAVRFGAAAIGLATVGIGIYDATIILEGFIYAIPEN